jgi:hypothetical protein
LLGQHFRVDTSPGREVAQEAWRAAIRARVALVQMDPSEGGNHVLLGAAVFQLALVCDGDERQKVLEHVLEVAGAAEAGGIEEPVLAEMRSRAAGLLGR